MDEIRIPEKLQAWISARERYQLTHAQVQMGRELGLNPRKLGEKVKARTQQEPLSVPDFIDASFLKRFGKPQPDDARSVEDRSRAIAEKRAARWEERLSQKHGEADGDEPPA